MGSVSGTTWHGLLDNDQWRREFLAAVAQRVGRRFVADATTSFADRREERIERVADLVETHLDADALMALLEAPTSVTPPCLELRRHGDGVKMVAQ